MSSKQSRTSRPFGGKGLRWPVFGAFVASVAGCGTAPASKTAGGANVGSALLLVTDTYELQLQGGRIIVYESGVSHEVERYEELRELYRRNDGPPLPERPDADGTNVFGWRDLECVRLGQTCGREPDMPARDMIRLKLRF